MFRSITNIRGFSHDDDDDTDSYLTMAARGIHECQVDFFTVNVPKEEENIDFSHSFSEIGSDFKFGLKCDNIKSDRKCSKTEKKEVHSDKKHIDKKSDKMSKLKQKYIVNDNQRLICTSKENKTSNGKRLTIKWNSV